MHIATGIPALDELLGGGIPTGQLTLSYGEAGSGKSTLMMQLALSTAISGSKAIYIQTDGVFPSERFKQIAGSQWKPVTQDVPILEIRYFAQQEKLVEFLPRYINPSVRLVIWDTFTSLYRTALSTSQQNVLLNKLLSRQLAFLLEIAREEDVAMVLAAQMRAIIHQEGNGEPTPPDTEGPVAENVLDYWTKTRIKLEKSSQLNIKKLIVERHPSIAQRSALLLRTSSKGLEAA